MDPKTIQEILRFVNKSDLAEVEIEEKGFKLRVKRAVPGSDTVTTYVHAAPAVAGPVYAPQPQLPQPAQQTANQPVTPVAVAPVAVSGFEIKSPMIGTLYCRPNPDSEMFVKEGDIIRKGQVLCIIEAMKLFNDIESEVAGRVVKILCEDGKPVEYDQPLFLVELA
jgi:acetyl-CoA carboxylase biotin carboxyl carrier protein